ncbi:endothelin-converting enzyme [Metarhizium guizhouense ARSEF 977]|uniref:Endothelin-converting enzyme n=1 Tax=Metarhizium guizhouense (strain ARSEF 977) TaxID=1276136 RepID=A0A0B4I4N1_METGA|nr:endothelin-converting enzyme [Metarhizium guizhouense ARSEF 977]
MTAESDQALGHSEYWDKHYAKSDGTAPTHEWYCSFGDLEQFFQINLFEADGLKSSDNPLILHLGSGDSPSLQVIPVELASRGYKRQLCIDFSPTVVDLMTERHAEVKGIEWKLMDVRDMAGVADKSVDFAFDKGTLDAMIHGSPWNPPETVKENTSGYLGEVCFAMNTMKSFFPDQSPRFIGY